MYAEPIRAFNAAAAPHHFVHLEIVPGPYLGNPNAPVVLLNLNPGFVDDCREVHRESTFNDAARANLLHEASSWPLYLMNPKLASPGQDWWQRKLITLISAVGDAQAVASQVFVAELHGYHSARRHHRDHARPKGMDGRDFQSSHRATCRYYATREIQRSRQETVPNDSEGSSEL